MSRYREFPRRPTGFDRDNRPQPDEAPEPWVPLDEDDRDDRADDQPQQE
jgi:hypothetical protein